METMLLELSKIKPCSNLLSKVLKVIEKYDPKLIWPISKWYLCEVTRQMLKVLLQMILVMIQYYTNMAVK